jgi:hypothetical protein
LRALTVAADEERKEAKQVEDEGDNGPRVWLNPAERSTTCPADDVLAKDRCRPEVHEPPALLDEPPAQ